MDVLVGREGLLDIVDCGHRHSVVGKIEAIEVPIVTYAFRRAIAVPAIVKAPDRAAAPGGGTRTTQLARYRRRRRRGPQTLVGHR
jgi:hypothetical protein